MKVDVILKDHSKKSFECCFFSNSSTNSVNDCLIYVPKGLTNDVRNRKICCAMSKVLCFSVSE